MPPIIHSLLLRLIAARITRFYCWSLRVALAFCLVATGATRLQATETAIPNNQRWYDTDGNEILNQGGGIIKILPTDPNPPLISYKPGTTQHITQTTYYWYGYRQSDNAGGRIQSEIHCYSSTDLMNWQYQGLCVDGIYNSDYFVGRPDVIRRSTDGVYVMVSSGAGNSVTDANGITHQRNGLVFYTSSSPLGVVPRASLTAPHIPGSFTVVARDKSPTGTTMGDHSVFKEDSSSTAYLLLVTDDYLINGVALVDGRVKIAQLNSNYVGINQTVGELYHWDAAYDSTLKRYDQREAPCMVHRAGGDYYLFTSLADDYNSSLTKYWRSSSLTSGWAALTPLNSGASTNSYDTQVDFIMTIRGWAGTSYIYAGDRWSQYTSDDDSLGKNAWYPLAFDGNGSPTQYGYANWTINATAGVWTTSSNPNGPADGTYTIKNRNSGLYLGLANGVTAEGSIVYQYSDTSNDNTRWTLFYLGNNQYKIVHAASGRSLTINDGTGTPQNGTVGTISNYAAGAGQKWTFTPTASPTGYYELFKGTTGKALNINGSLSVQGPPSGSTSAFAEQWDSTGSGWSSEQWLLDNLAN